MTRFIAIPAILAVFALWAGYTAGVGYLIERNLPDRTPALTQPIERQAAPCVPYPPYPDTRICGKIMQHRNPNGRWVFMADLTVPKKGIPRPRPVVPLNRGRYPVSFDGVGYQFRAIEPLVERWVGKHVEVSCENMGRGGYGAYGDNPAQLWLARPFCNPLRSMIGGGHAAPALQGVGLITLTHEMLHARGIDDEARTECVAFQNVDNVGRAWGVKRRWLNKILGYAYRDHRALVAHAPRYANLRKCRPNGAWDQTPYDGRWP